MAGHTQTERGRRGYDNFKASPLALAPGKIAHV